MTIEVAGTDTRVGWRLSMFTNIHVRQPWLRRLGGVSVWNAKIGLWSDFLGFELYPHIILIIQPIGVDGWFYFLSIAFTFCFGLL